MPEHWLDADMARLLINCLPKNNRVGCMQL